MLLSPDQYGQASVRELLEAAACGRIGLDHRWLRAILERGEACAPDLLAFLREAPEEDVADLEQHVLALARALASPAMLPVLIELAHRYSDGFPDLLADALRSVGAPAVEPLLELRRRLEDPWELDTVLAGLGVRDARVLEILLESLRRSPADGALLLAIYGDPAARPALEEALARAADEYERGEIRQALEALEEGRPLEPPEPFDIWSLYPERDEPAYGQLAEEDLVELLSSPPAEWRLGAARELAARASETDAGEHLLKLAREDPDAEVRGVCWQAVGRSSLRDQCRRAMLERLADPSTAPAERRGILLGLAEEAADPLVRRWILDFYDHPETRAAALEAMRFSGDGRFAPYLRERLEDPDAEVRRQAVLGLGALQMRGELYRLPPMFRDEQVRREALLAYAALVPLELSRPGARQCLRKIERLAGGLSRREGAEIEQILDERLAAAGRFPAFQEIVPEEEEEEPPVRRAKVGPNDPCPCGSGKKYKKCCGA